MNEKVSTTISEDYFNDLTDTLNSIINIPVLNEEQEEKIIKLLLTTLLKLLKKYIS